MQLSSLDISASRFDRILSFWSLLAHNTCPWNNPYSIFAESLPIGRRINKTGIGDFILVFIFSFRFHMNECKWRNSELQEYLNINTVNSKCNAVTKISNFSEQTNYFEWPYALANYGKIKKRTNFEIANTYEDLDQFS